MKFRKKPVVIEAFRPNIDLPAPDWFLNAINKGDVYYQPLPVGLILKVKTLEGDMACNHGDYLIKGVAGEIYPCKPNIFEATYEQVEE